MCLLSLTDSFIVFHVDLGCLWLLIAAYSYSIFMKLLFIKLDIVLNRFSYFTIFQRPVIKPSINSFSMSVIQLIRHLYYLWRYPGTISNSSGFATVGEWWSFFKSFQSVTSLNNIRFDHNTSKPFVVLHIIENGTFIQSIMVSEFIRWCISTHWVLWYTIIIIKTCKAYL